MKKAIIPIALVSSTMFFASCTKERVDQTAIEAMSTAKPHYSLISGTLTIGDEDLSSELLKYSEVLTLQDTKGNKLELLATSDLKSTIDEYKKDPEFTFEIIDQPTGTPVEIPSSEVVSPEETMPAGVTLIKFFVLSNPANSTQMILFISGPRKTTANSSSAFAKCEDWSDLGQNAQVNWTYTSNLNNDLRVNVRYKNCGWCSKYDLETNVFLGAASPSRLFAKSSAKRMYVRVWNNWFNRTVSIY